MNKAFSLLELSIVLVIIGLIAGGIVAGASMIRAAELRAVVTEFNRIQTASFTFQDKYLGLAGDLKNATSFWGSMTNCGVASPSGTGTQTCDGDGNSMIFNGQAVAGSLTGEMHGFWQHLANAELFEGTYTGIAGSNRGDDVDLGINAPESAMSGVGWGALNLNVSGSNVVFTMDYGKALMLGGEHVYKPEAGGFSAEELWSLDKKIDDGMPASGKVIARPSGGYSTAIQCVNSTGNTDYSATYRLDNTDKACAIIFKDAL